jgi:hypothetical protein
MDWTLGQPSNKTTIVHADWKGSQSKIYRWWKTFHVAVYIVKLSSTILIIFLTMTKLISGKPFNT